MATIRQKRLADNIVQNAQTRRWGSLKDLLLAAGYSKLTSSQNQKAVIQHKGVQKCLVKIGFSEDTAKAIVGEVLLLGDEQSRLKAADMIFKTFGTYAPEKSLNIHGTFAEVIEKLNKREQVT